MRAWLTAAEIAALGLPGMPSSKRNVNAHALRSGWYERRQFCRIRAQAGGGTEYHIDLLPPEARKAYVARQISADVAVVPAALAQAAEAEPEAPVLRDRAAEERDARLALLAAADRLARDARLPRRHADVLFLADYNAGRLDLPAWIRDRVQSLSLRTLLRWRASARQGRTAALAIDKGAARRGSGLLDRANDGEVRVYCLALLVKQPHLSADHVRRLIKAKFGTHLTVRRPGGSIELVPVPPIRTIQHALATWRLAERVALTALTNPDAFKSRYRLAGSNTDRAVTRLNEVWQIDASPMDALCIDGRHTVYVAVDVFSRRVAVYVTRTPRAEAVGLLTRRALLAWGVPERIKTDNGSDFTARATGRLFAALGIEHDLAPPFSPEQKAFVERAIGTFQRDLGPLLPGFIGHSVADRKVIEARKAFAARLGESEADAFAVELTAAELQSYCDRWATDRYAHRPHEGLAGRTPASIVAAWGERGRRIADIRALDLLLAPVAGRDGLRTVGKQGVRIDGSHYLAPAVLPDTPVLVRMDPNDLGRAYLFAPDGSLFLAEAHCPELLGIDPAEAVARAKAAQREFIAEGTAAIRREARKIKPRDMVEGVLGRGGANVVPLSRLALAHSTPALEAAGAVHAPPAQALALSEPDAAMMAEIEADLAGTAPPISNVTPLRTTDTPQQRFRRALELGERLEAGETVPAEDLLWLGGYRAGPEFRSLRTIYEDFGEAALR